MLFEIEDGEEVESSEDRRSGSLLITLGNLKDEHKSPQDLRRGLLN